MAGPWRTTELPGIVATLATRPKHETLRTLMQDILHSGFGAAHAEIAHEVYLAEGRGRIDTMFGATVIELKSDLRRELPDVLKRLPDYLADEPYLALSMPALRSGLSLPWPVAHPSAGGALRWRVAPPSEV